MAAKIANKILAYLLGTIRDKKNIILKAAVECPEGNEYLV